MNWLHLIDFDQWLLTWSEKVCHNFERRTGKSSLWLFAQLDICALFFFLYMLYRTNVQQLPSFFIETLFRSDASYKKWIWLLVASVLFTNWWHKYKRTEATAKARLALGRVNPLKHQLRSRFARYTFCWLWPVITLRLIALEKPGTTSLPIFVLWLLITVGSYLIACDPLPARNDP